MAKAGMAKKPVPPPAVPIAPPVKRPGRPPPAWRSTLDAQHVYELLNSVAIEVASTDWSTNATLSHPNRVGSGHGVHVRMQFNYLRGAGRGGDRPLGLWQRLQTPESIA
jgi:hypothetical protein